MKPLQSEVFGLHTDLGKCTERLSVSFAWMFVVLDEVDKFLTWLSVLDTVSWDTRIRSCAGNIGHEVEVWSVSDLIGESNGTRDTNLSVVWTAAAV